MFYHRRRWATAVSIQLHGLCSRAAKQVPIALHIKTLQGKASSPAQQKSMSSCPRAGTFKRLIPY